MFAVAIGLVALIRADLVRCNESKDIEYLKLECNNMLFSTSTKSHFLEEESIGESFMDALEEVDAMSARPSAKILAKVQDLVTEWERQLREINHESELRQPRFFQMFTDRRRHQLEVALTYGYYYLSLRFLKENLLLQALAEIDYLLDLRGRSTGVPFQFVVDMEQSIHSAIRGVCNSNEQVFQLLGPSSISTLSELDKSYQKMRATMDKYASRDISELSRSNLEFAQGVLSTAYEIKKSLLEQSSLQ